MENISIQTLITVCSAIATLITAVSVIKKFSKEKVECISKEVSDEIAEEVVEKISTSLVEIKEQLDTLETKVDTNQDSTDKMLMSTARYNINRAFDFYMKQGSIDDHGIFVLEDLYKRYVALGGNGQVEIQMTNLRNLYKKSCEEGKN